MSKKMTPRERAMAVLNGEEPDLTPIYGYTNMRIYSQGGWIRRCMERGMGKVAITAAYNSGYPFPTINVDIKLDRKIYIEDGVVKNLEVIETPVGTVSQILRWNTVDYVSPNYEEHFVKKTSDWRVINYVYKAYLAALQPNYQYFNIVEDEVGESGFTYAWIEKTPFPRAWVELSTYQQVLVDFQMESPEVLEYVDIQYRIHEKIAQICAESPCKFLNFGEHITDVVSPSYYRKYCMPVYEIYRKALAGTDKVFSCHMDGKFGQLKKEIAETPFNAFESFTTPPNGDVSLTEARELWPNLIVMMNLPAHLAFSKPEEIRAGFESIKAELKGSKKGFMLVHSEEIPLDKLEPMLNIAMDVFGY